MLNEPTTISSAARLIGETLQEDYGVDPAPLFDECSIDKSLFVKPGSRIAFSKMSELWIAAVDATSDPAFGIKVGSRVVPSDLYVLGHAWLASETLLDAMHRTSRFIRVLSTVGNSIDVRREGDRVIVTDTFADRIVEPRQAAKDAGTVAWLRMCDAVSRDKVRPVRVVLPRAEGWGSVDYETVIGCPVEQGKDIETWEFLAADVVRPLTGSIPDVADAIEQIANSYIESLEEGAVAHEVRQMLIQMLPSGRSDQDTIASRLFRSRSTLQRQLGAEGTSYREILDSTREALAEKYLLSGDYTQAEVAFMVGFSDQSNFARAFKRWTGMSPGEFQNAA